MNCYICKKETPVGMFCRPCGAVENCWSFIVGHYNPDELRELKRTLECGSIFEIRNRHPGADVLLRLLALIRNTTPPDVSPERTKERLVSRIEHHWKEVERILEFDRTEGPGKWEVAFGRMLKHHLSQCAIKQREEKPDKFTSCA